eukprot:RCo046634
MYVPPKKSSFAGLSASSRADVSAINAVLRGRGIALPPERSGEQKELFLSMMTLLAIHANAVFSDPTVLPELMALMQGLNIVIGEGKGTVFDDHTTSMLVTAVRRLLFYGTDLAPAARPARDAATKNTEADVRNTAVQLVATSVRSNHKAFVSQWVHLLPDHAATSPRPFTPTLFTVLLYDPVPRVRSAAYFAVSVLLEDSRPYLQQADDSNRASASFTAYSTRLGCMLAEMHRALAFAVFRENSPHLLSMCLKTVATLVTNTPFYKLQLSAEFMQFFTSEQLATLLFHQDRGVRASAICLYAAAFSTAKPIPGMQEYITSAKAEQLLDRLLGNLLEPSAGPKAETVRLFASLALRNRPYVIRKWPELFPSLKLMVRDKESTVRHGVLTFIQNYTENEEPELSTAAGGGAPDEDEGGGPPAAKEGGPLRRIPSEQWRDILDHILSLSVADPLQSLRAATFACYAHLTGDTVADFQPEEIELLLRRMLTHITDETAAVRSSICKVLGGWIYFPYICENPVYVSDLILALSTLMAREEVLHARVRGAWALANMCDALRISQFRGIPAPEQVCSALLTASLTGSRESYKVKCNVVRALGNLGHSASASWLLQPFDMAREAQTLLSPKRKGSMEVNWRAVGQHSSYSPITATPGANFSVPPRGGSPAPMYSRLHTMLTELVAALSDANVKVRWNGCYGIGKVISNPCLVHVAEAVASLTATAMQSMCTAIQCDPNFKVRIQASQALAAPKVRALYGSSLSAVWTAVILALKVVHVTDDLDQFKLKNTLKNQLFLTLRHLIEVSGPIAAELSLHDLLGAHSAYLSSTLDAIEEASGPLQPTPPPHPPLHPTALSPTPAAGGTSSSVVLPTSCDSSSVGSGGVAPTPECSSQCAENARGSCGGALSEGSAPDNVLLLRSEFADLRAFLEGHHAHSSTLTGADTAAQEGT